jgi:hypothetical protein
MKKFVAGLLALSLMAIGSGAFADNASLDGPRDEKGGPIHPFYGGYKHTRVASTTERVVCSGHCLLKEILRSTGAVTSFLTIRNTSTADGGGEVALPKWRFTTFETDVLRPLLSDSPLRMTKGISAQLSSVSANEEVVIVYIDFDE